jgi:hypothetical protein
VKAAFLFLGVSLLWAQDVGVVEGAAFNRVTQAGVSGVAVKLAASSACDKPQYLVTSNATGAFQFDGVKEGDYLPTFEAPHGYLAPHRADPASRPFHVARGAVVHLPVPLTPLGSLRGRVLDAGGQPVARVRVELFRVHAMSGAVMTTDANGQFSQDGLVPGAYQLRARPVLAGTPLGRKPENISPLAPKPPEEEGWIWAPTYFPDATEITAAETIVVHEGSDLSGYEIRLRSAPVYHLRGSVFDDEGKPAGGVKLLLLSEIGWGRAEAAVESGKDGGFEFPAVRPGDWQITAELQRGSVSWQGFADLRMPQHDVDDAKVRMYPPFELAGAVEGIQTPGTRTRVAVSLMPVAGGEESMSTEAPDGSLHFEKLYPGRYRVAVWDHVPGYYLKSVLLDNHDVMGRDVSLDRAVSPLRVVYKSNAARVHGTVEDGAGVMVALIDADQERFDPFQSLRVTGCDGEGRFNFEGLYPATYFAFAFVPNGNVESGAVKDAVFTLGVRQQAQTVRLGEGDTATLNLNIVTWPE